MHSDAHGFFELIEGTESRTDCWINGLMDGKLGDFRVDGVFGGWRTGVWLRWEGWIVAKFEQTGIRG